MSEAGPRRRTWLWALLALAALVVVFVMVVVLAPFDAIVAEDPTGPWPYLAVFALVFGDAIIPVLPGETTLNTGSTLAAQGLLELGWVIVAGALGAVLGDSALYWIARRSRSLVQSQLEAALANEKVATAQRLIGSTSATLIVFGRYVPGMRFVVNASLGLAEHPYWSFLRWSAIAGVLWSIYICTVAYAVGTVLADSPVASIVISALASSVAVVIVFAVLARRIRGSRRDRR